MRRWQMFRPADESNDIIDYMHDRGFRSVSRLCERYDLRYAPRGPFARRVLIPIHDGNQQVTWTGRAIDADRELRYLMQEVDRDGLIYIPRLIREVCFAVEGPIDALKIAAATESNRISAVGLMGLGLSEARILSLIEALQHCTLLLLAPDSTVPDWSRLLNYLRGNLPSRITVGRASLAGIAKDAGELSYEGVRQWAKGAIGKYLPQLV
jgi:hypothetical protein